MGLDRVESRQPKCFSQRRTRRSAAVWACNSALRQAQDWIGAHRAPVSGGDTMAMRKTYVPHGVIPAVLLPFNADLSIDEASFRKHLRDVAATDGISAITINAHSTEVASCTFEEQRRVLEIT